MTSTYGRLRSHVSDVCNLNVNLVSDNTNGRDRGNEMMMQYL